MSWNELIAITQEAKELRRDDRRKPLVDCPQCGEVLVSNARGVLDCPMGHFRQRGTVRGPESY